MQVFVEDLRTDENVAPSPRAGPTKSKQLSVKSSNRKPLSKLSNSRLNSRKALDKETKRKTGSGKELQMKRSVLKFSSEASQERASAKKDTVSRNQKPSPTRRTAPKEACTISIPKTSTSWGSTDAEIPASSSSLDQLVTKTLVRSPSDFIFRRNLRREAILQNAKSTTRRAKKLRKAKRKDANSAWPPSPSDLILHKNLTKFAIHKSAQRLDMLESVENLVSKFQSAQIIR